MLRAEAVLIGVTTENPSFEVNSALLLRAKVFVLQPLKMEELCTVLTRALRDPRGFGEQKFVISDNLVRIIAEFANGGVRTALSTLEMVILNGEVGENGTILVSKAIFEQCISKKSLLYDKNGEEHYNIISALHKSKRNSDPDAAI